jgi:hypothetical protein
MIAKAAKDEPVPSNVVPADAAPALNAAAVSAVVSVTAAQIAREMGLPQTPTRNRTPAAALRITTHSFRWTGSASNGTSRNG